MPQRRAGRVWAGGVAGWGLGDGHHWKHYSIISEFRFANIMRKVIGFCCGPSAFVRKSWRLFRSIKSEPTTLFIYIFCVTGMFQPMPKTFVSFLIHLTPAACCLFRRRDNELFPLKQSQLFSPSTLTLHTKLAAMQNYENGYVSFFPSHFHLSGNNAGGHLISSGSRWASANIFIHIKHAHADKRTQVCFRFF